MKPNAIDLIDILKRATELGVLDASKGNPVSRGAAVLNRVRRIYPGKWPLPARQIYQDKIKQAYGSGFDMYQRAKHLGDVE